MGNSSSIQVCLDRDFSIAIKFLSRAHVLVVYAPQPGHVRDQSAVTARLGPVMPTLLGSGCAMSRHDLDIKTQTQSRPRMSGRDMGTSSSIQVWHDRDFFVATEFLYFSHVLVVYVPWPGHVRAQSVVIACPGLVVYDRAFCRGQLCRDLKILFAKESLLTLANSTAT